MKRKLVRICVASPYNSVMVSLPENRALKLYVFVVNQVIYSFYFADYNDVTTTRILACAILH